MPFLAVGSMTEEREEGRVRCMFCQLNNASTKAVRWQKMRGMIFLAKKYDVGIRLFNEHGCNMNNAQRGEDFASWIQIGEKIGVWLYLIKMTHALRLSTSQEGWGFM